MMKRWRFVYFAALLFLNKAHESQTQNLCQLSRMGTVGGDNGTWGFFFKHTFFCLWPCSSLISLLDLLLSRHRDCVGTVLFHRWNLNSHSSHFARGVKIFTAADAVRGSWILSQNVLKSYSNILYKLSNTQENWSNTFTSITWAIISPHLFSCRWAAFKSSNTFQISDPQFKPKQLDLLWKLCPWMHPRLTAVESSVSHCVSVPTVLFTGISKLPNCFISYRILLVDTVKCCRTLHLIRKLKTFFALCSTSENTLFFFLSMRSSWIGSFDHITGRTGCVYECVYVCL